MKLPVSKSHDLILTEKIIVKGLARLFRDNI